MESYMGTIQAFAFNYAPQAWAFCNGQLLNVNQNAALYSLLGNIYGGNSPTTFALPDLRGRTAIGMGQGAGLQNYAIGQSGGTENTTLTIANLAPHTHAGGLQVVVPGRTAPPPTAGYYLAAAQSIDPATSPTTVQLGGLSISTVGSGTPFSTLQPYLAINYCICVQGLYPPRQ